MFFISAKQKKKLSQRWTSYKNNHQNQGCKDSDKVHKVSSCEPEEKEKSMYQQMQMPGSYWLFNTEGCKRPCFNWILFVGTTSALKLRQPK